MYWDTSDAANEGGAWRIRWETGDEESGPWDWPVDQQNGGIADAVVELARQHGAEIEPGDVAVEGLYGFWQSAE